MLATYKRDRQVFNEIFGISAATLIKTMDAAAADPANQQPEHSAKDTIVGVRREDIPVNIVDPLNDALTQQLRCNVRVSVSLDAMRRGIHVSRMSNVLADLSSRPYDNLLEFTGRAAQRVAETQGATSCHIRAEGVYTFLEFVEGWDASKNKKSIEAVPLIAESFHTVDAAPKNVAGFKVSHITACPCVQSAIQTLLRLKGIDEKGIPLFTHSQRCETEILLKNLKCYLDFAAALRLADQCMTRTQNTLPREHELALVHGSHQTPSFLEDVVRCCANKFGQEFSNILDENGGVHVSSVSQESIHCFDLHAEAFVPASSINKQSDLSSDMEKPVPNTEILVNVKPQPA